MNFDTEEQRKEWLKRQHEADERAFENKYGFEFVMLHPITKEPIFEKDLEKKEEQRMAIDKVMTRKFKRLASKKKGGKR